MQNKRQLQAEEHLLRNEYGLTHVFNTFPACFKARCTGNGRKSTSANLGKFIALYEEWQRQLFPHSTFDYFLDKVEAEAGKRVVTNVVDRMRDRYVYGIDVDANAHEEAHAQHADASAADETQQEHARPELVDALDDEEDQRAWMQFNQQPDTNEAHPAELRNQMQHAHSRGAARSKQHTDDRSSDDEA